MPGPARPARIWDRRNIASAVGRRRRDGVWKQATTRAGVVVDPVRTRCPVANTAVRDRVMKVFVEAVPSR